MRVANSSWLLRAPGDGEPRYFLAMRNPTDPAITSSALNAKWWENARAAYEFAFRIEALQDYLVQRVPE